MNQFAGNFWTKPAKHFDNEAHFHIPVNIFCFNLWWGKLTWWPYKVRFGVWDFAHKIVKSRISRIFFQNSSAADDTSPAVVDYHSQWLIFTPYEWAVINDYLICWIIFINSRWFSTQWNNHSKNHVVNFTTTKTYSVRFQKSIESKI
jgi:hypothetical protein